MGDAVETRFEGHLDDAVADLNKEVEECKKDRLIVRRLYAWGETIAKAVAVQAGRLTCV